MGWCPRILGEADGEGGRIGVTSFFSTGGVVGGDSWVYNMIQNNKPGHKEQCDIMRVSNTKKRKLTSLSSSW